MSLKVLIIIATNNIGGPGKGIFQLINHSDSEEVEFYLANFIQKDQATFEFMEECQRQGVKLHLIKQHSRFDFSMVKQVANLIQSNKCDLIQTHGYKGHIIGYLLRKKFGIKWITVAHGWTNENIKIKLYTFIEKLLIRRSDYAITVSPTLYDTVGKIRGIQKPTSLILNAIVDVKLPSQDELDKVRNKYQLGKSLVLGVLGRFSEEKGQSFVIKAVAEIKKYHSDVKLLLLGEGVDEDKLRLLVERYELQSNVLFCGYQSNVNAYLGVVDFVLVPSLSEGIPNIVLESLYLHKAVIATNVGGIPEIIADKKNGWLIQAGSEKQISDKVLELLDSDEEVEKVKKNARASLFPKFSIENRVESFLHVYKKTCGHV